MFIVRGLCLFYFRVVDGGTRIALPYYSTMDFLVRRGLAIRVTSDSPILAPRVRVGSGGCCGARSSRRYGRGCPCPMSRSYLVGVPIVDRYCHGRLYAIREYHDRRVVSVFV